MLPANQCLDRRGPPGAQIDLGLVMQDQLAARDRRAQTTEQLEALTAVLVGVGGVDGHPDRQLLGPVHSHVSAPHQRSWITSVSGSERDPDTSVHAERESADIDTFGQRGTHPARGRQGVSGSPRRRRQQDRELVPAEAGDRRGRPGGAPQPRRHLTEHVVAGTVSQRVVDLLEPVKIHQ